MDSVARTAYYCCGVRAHDAASSSPICGDELAQRFMSPEGLEYFSHLKVFEGPLIGNAARHRMIDDLLRDRLKQDPTHLVVLLGAGFDTRAFRLKGGRWLEIDQPAVLDLKEQILPSDSAQNPLVRKKIDFSCQKLGDVLGGLEAISGVSIVMEGVSFYLKRPELLATLAELKRHFPKHRLICDLQTRRFATSAGAKIRKRLASMGAIYGDLYDRPWTQIEDAGYRRLSRASIIGFASMHGKLPVPSWFLNTIGRSMRDGYTVCEFEMGITSD